MAHCGYSPVGKMRFSPFKIEDVDGVRSSSIEPHTLWLAVAVYGGWITATLFHGLLPLPLLPLIGGWLLAWQGSLQHETIHGHPTPWPRINAMLGAVPLSLWLPYACYRRTHLAHHASEYLTVPGSDPESRYLDGGSGIGARVRRRLAVGSSTLLGRLILGPPFEIIGFLWAEATLLLQGDKERLKTWTGHLIQAALIVAWLKLACGMSLLSYALWFIYPGAALTLLRSFAEHRDAPDPGHRIAIVEQAPIFGLLFLNNNLHAVHHRHPRAGWWELPKLYRRDRERILEENGGLVYRGYRDVFQRYALTPHDQLIHRSSASVISEAAA
jgi:fatty acid desaturase